MGIIMAVSICAGLLTVGGLSYGTYRMREDRSIEKIEKIIQDVDMKPEKRKPEDILKAALDKVNEDEVDARWIIAKTKSVIKEPEARVIPVNEMCDEVDKAIEEMDAFMEEPETEETKEPETIKAVDYNTMSFYQMEEVFDRMYNPYPVQVARSSLFGKARSEGLITDETYQKAYEHYGRLWNYVGD